MMYAGAKGKSLSLADLEKLGPRWVLSPKLDGIYVEADLDSEGRICLLTMRSGKLVPSHIASEMMRLRIGPPYSRVAGELEAWTEASGRAIARNGFRRIWLFDMLACRGRSLVDLPYRERRDHLMRTRAELELEVGADRPWVEDAAGNAHHSRSGRFVRKVPQSWRRVPIVQQVAAQRLDEAMSWVDGDDLVEGLVAVNLDAPVGRRGAKRKWKPRTTIDAVVLEVGRRNVTLHWPGADLVFAVGQQVDLEVTGGEVVEVAAEGFYASGLPRFPRLTRRRPDLRPSCKGVSA